MLRTPIYTSMLIFRYQQDVQTDGDNRRDVQPCLCQVKSSHDRLASTRCEYHAGSNLPLSYLLGTSHAHPPRVLVRNDELGVVPIDLEGEWRRACIVHDQSRALGDGAKAGERRRQWKLIMPGLGE